MMEISDSPSKVVVDPAGEQIARLLETLSQSRDEALRKLRFIAPMSDAEAHVKLQAELTNARQEYKKRVAPSILVLCLLPLTPILYFGWHLAINGFTGNTVITGTMLLIVAMLMPLVAWRALKNRPVTSDEVVDHLSNRSVLRHLGNDELRKVLHLANVSPEARRIVDGWLSSGHPVRLNQFHALEEYAQYERGRDEVRAELEGYLARRHASGVTPRLVMVDPNGSAE